MTDRREPPADDPRAADARQPATDDQPAASHRSAADDQPAAGDQPRDPSRRQFFRAFGRQTVTSAGQALRAVDELRRGSANAATELLGIGVRDPRSSAARLERSVIAAATSAETIDLADQGVTAADGAADFRSPYMFTGAALNILDQRTPLDRPAIVSCRTAHEVAAAVRDGAAGGGPVLAQVAAYALVLAAFGAAPRLPQAREAAFRAAANTLHAARPHARAVTWATERMTRRWDELAGDASANAQIEALRDEADKIATDAALDNARLGRFGAEALPEVAGRALSLLVHADMGPLAGGLVGTGFAVIQSAASAGREVHAWVTEAAPSLEGARIAAPQFALADLPHTVIPDTAVAWLLAEHPVDAVLLRADWICANGDCAALLGSLGVARLARANGVPVYACATGSVIDPATRDGGAIPRSRSQPELDVVPGALTNAFVTDAGVRAAPFGEGVGEGVG
jgi:methylthioribose-1-phosphate isomerase